jgi:hypothetical protein
MNVHLTPELEQFVQNKVQSGRSIPRARWFVKPCV